MRNSSLLLVIVLGVALTHSPSLAFGAALSDTQSPNVNSATVTPQMFGAKGDGHTDDTSAIQKAIDSGKKVLLPEGTYLVGGHITPGVGGAYLENRLLTLRSNLQITGAGKKTIIFLKDHLLDGLDDKTSNAHIFGGYNVENVSISGIQFFMNGEHNLTPPGKIRNAMAIFVVGGKNVHVEHNFFYNCAGRNVVSFRSSDGSGALINNNEFRNGGHYVGGPIENVNNTDFSFIYTEWANSSVDNNWIEEDNLAVGLNTKGLGPGGIELHGSHSHANGNTIIGTMPGIYVTASPTEISDVEVRSNKIKDSIEGVHFVPAVADVKDVRVIENEISVTQTPAGDAGPCYALFIHGGGNENFNQSSATVGVLDHLLIRGNKISNAFPLGKTWDCGGVMLHSLHNSQIVQNNIRGMTTSGIILLGSPWGSSDVQIHNNIIVDCGAVATLPYKTSIFFSQFGGSRIPAKTFHAEDITMTGNTLGNSANSVIENSGITLAAIKGSKLQNIRISGNRFVNVRHALFDGHTDLPNPQILNPEVHFTP